MEVDGMKVESGKRASISEEDRKFILDNYKNYSLDDFHNYFDKKYEKEQIRWVCRKNNIKCKKLTSEEREKISIEDKRFIVDNCKNYSLPDFYKHFNKKYGKTTIRRFCDKNGIECKKVVFKVLNKEDKEFILKNCKKYTVKELAELLENKYTTKNINGYLSNKDIDYKRSVRNKELFIGKDDIYFIKNNKDFTVDDIFDHFKGKYSKKNIRGTLQRYKAEYKKVISEGIKKEDKEYIINNYKENTINDFFKYFNEKYTKDSIKHYLRKKGLDYKKQINHWVEIKEEDVEYLKKNTDKNLVELYDYFEKRYTKEQISHFCFYYNIEYRKMTNEEIKDNNTERKRFIDVDQDYFKKWTPNMAFTFGFWTSDGNCYIKNGSYNIQIGLKKEDLYMLESFLKGFKSGGHKIKTRKKDGFKSICIGSKKMIKDLSNLKCTPRKSHTLELCKDISDELFHHYLRGHFDGDGSVYSIEKTGNYKSEICGASENFINDLYKKIKGIDNSLHGSISKRLKKGRKNYIYVIKFSKFDSMKLAIMMYKGADLRLKRKFERFCKAFEMPIKTKRKKEIELELQLKEVWKNEILPSIKS